MKGNQLRRATSLTPETADDQPTYRSLSFNTAYGKLQSISRKLKNKFKSTKDDFPKLHRSGIYRLSCQPGCGATYIGQSRRRIETRRKEHFANFRKSEVGKSAFADHLINEGHFVNSECQKLVKEVNRSEYLDIHASIEIAIERRNNQKILNSDRGPIETIYSRLFSWHSHHSSLENEDLIPS